MDIFIDTQLWIYAFKSLRKRDFQEEKITKKLFKCMVKLMVLHMMH